MASSNSGTRLIAVAALLAIAAACAWFLRDPEPPPPPPASVLRPVPVSPVAPRPSQPAAKPGRIRVDPDLPEYAQAGKIQGELRSAGSDTMNNVMTLWAEGFHKHYPGVQIHVEGKGSSSAPPALTAGASELGPMSREMKKKEIDAFVTRFGHEPTALATCIDMLAVFVHRDNPIQGLTLPQVDAIFSKGRKGGHGTDIVKWGDLGLTGEWADMPISLYGRNSSSGTYGYFKQHAIYMGDYKPSVKEQAGSLMVVHGVAMDRYGIGYSGIGYGTDGVRAVPLAKGPDQPLIEPVAARAYSGEYPLGRYLYLYVNNPPRAVLGLPLREFLRYVYSRQGQLDVSRADFLPLPAAFAREQLAKVGLR